MTEAKVPVRYSLMLRGLRITMGLLSRFAPASATRIAWRMWFTPPVSRLTSYAHETLSAARAFEVTVGGRRIACWEWGGGPAVILVHGWGGYGAQLASFVEPLRAAGHRVVTFDAPSHGQSAPGEYGPRKSHVFEFARALQAVHAASGEVQGLVAHSLGCTATAWALRSGLKIPRAVFIAPLDDPQIYAANFGYIMNLSPAVSRAWQRHAEQMLAFRWEDLRVAGLDIIDAFPRLLVVHDRHDPETRWEDGRAIASAWPQAQLITTNGLGHYRVLHDTVVVRHAVEHFTPPLSA